MRAPLRLLSAVVLLVIAAWWWPAQAHTGLVSSDPEDGSTVSSAPSRIVLTFSEDLKDPSEAVVQVAGQPQTWGAEVDGPDLVLSPGGDIGDGAGAWQVSYRVVSADGHPVTGTITFTVAGSTATSSPTATTAPTTAPTTAATTVPTTGEPSPAAGEGDDGGSSTPLIVGGIVAVLVLVLAAALLTRRRDTSEDDTAAADTGDDADDAQ